MVDAHRSVRLKTAKDILHLTSNTAPNSTASHLKEFVRQLPVHVQPPKKSLERLVLSSNEHIQSFRNALTARKYSVPVDGKAASCKCRITDQRYARRFKDRKLNVFFSDLFESLPLAVASAGLPQVSLSRYCLHHGHIFSTYSTNNIGILFHSREYPCYHEEHFNVILGYCQQKSDVIYDLEGMKWRNMLWYDGQTVAIDVGVGSVLQETLVLDGLQDVFTVDEEDFGVPLGDVYYLRNADRREQHSVYVFPR